MAACEVSQIVASIVSAYNNGLDVFKKLRCRKKGKASSKDTKIAEEEALLQVSLHHRPRDIRYAYDSNVAALGHRFEIGDTIAHSSLAHTLLVLNSGLINVLNNSLSNDAVKRRQSQRSLLNISEVAAADALFALGQLNHRLTTYQPKIPPPLLTQVVESKPAKASRPRKPSKTVVDIQIDPKSKSRAENNLLVRGGWVRPRPPRTRSGSSVVTAASSRNASTTKLTDHKRSKSGTASPSEPTRSTKGSPRPSHSRTQSSPAVPTTQLPYMAELPSSNEVQHRHHSPTEYRRVQREPSMLLVPSDFFDSQIDLLPSSNRPPPMITLHSRPNPHTRHPSSGSGGGMRPRPPSVATFMTTSTKIGEIPESRWPDRVPRVDEQLRPMPYVIPPPLNVEEPLPRKRRGLRFWRKSEPVAAQVQAAVY